jgi:hypothetical protein
MIAIDVEDELRWYFVSAAAELGEKGSSVAGGTGGSTGTEVTMGITDRQASAACKWRRIDAALAAIGPACRAVLQAGYEPVSTYKVPMGSADEQTKGRREAERVAGVRLGGKGAQGRRDVERKFRYAMDAYVVARRGQMRAERDERRERRADAAARRRSRPTRAAVRVAGSIKRMAAAVRDLLALGGIVLGREGCRDDAEW